MSSSTPFPVQSSPYYYFCHSDPRTRVAQRLHQELAQHHVLCHSFFSCIVSEQNLLPIHSFCSHFIWVLPEPTRPQSPQPAASSHFSTNKLNHVYGFKVRSRVCYCFNNTQGTDRDHLLNTHHCRTCNALTEPILDKKRRRRNKANMHLISRTPVVASAKHHEALKSQNWRWL